MRAGCRVPRMSQEAAPQRREHKLHAAPRSDLCGSPRLGRRAGANNRGAGTIIVVAASRRSHAACAPASRAALTGSSVGRSFHRQHRPRFSARADPPPTSWKGPDPSQPHRSGQLLADHPNSVPPACPNIRRDRGSRPSYINHRASPPTATAWQHLTTTQAETRGPGSEWDSWLPAESCRSAWAGGVWWGRLS